MRKILLLSACLLPYLLLAEVRMPNLFSDNMVIQRDKEIKVWGWADKNETVEVRFNGQVKKAKANTSGDWSVRLTPTAYGGPYELSVKGKNNTLSFKNILIGDVWLCSGQSNMEWQVNSVNNADSEIASANYPEIRSFNVEKDMSAVPKNDLKGTWTVCSPQTVGAYSAVAYFFARKIHLETGIPIGIINSSWGGTDIETWISPQSFNTLPEKFKARYKEVIFGDDFETFMKENTAKKQQYEEALANDPGLQNEWYKNGPGSGLKSMPVPSYWSANGLNTVDGIIWFQYEITLPEGVMDKGAVLSLGCIDDRDITWVNGVKVGETNEHNRRRNYAVPPGVLREGKNNITVRVLDTGGDGGIYGKPEEIYVEISGKRYSLAGEWKYKEAVVNSTYGYVENSPNMYSSLLYNAMIHPLNPFPIKGAIWYQGENNAGAAYNYRTLFPLLINDWRKDRKEEFPFYWVQLANFMAEDQEPADSNWAELREAQTMTLTLPHTGQAVIIDIGEANDIHPRNKQDVGLRLALNALYQDYGFKGLMYSGPVYKDMTVEGDKVILSFDHIGKGLYVKNKYGYLNGFAIAGPDKKFVWAKAYISGDRVVVYNDAIKNPVAVRYAWSNNPDVNLFNREGLPAVPFRTDTWKGITE